MIVNGRSLVDGVLAAPVAYATGLPLLFTRADVLPAVLREYLTEAGLARAVLIGSYAEITSTVGDELVALGLEVERIGGTAPPARSVALARAVGACGATSSEFALLDGNVPVDGLTLYALGGTERITSTLMRDALQAAGGTGGADSDSDTRVDTLDVTRSTTVYRSPIQTSRQSTHTKAADQLAPPQSSTPSSIPATTMPGPRADDGAWFADVAVGDWQLCGLRVDGTVSCWGESMADHLAPSGAFKSIGASVWHTCGQRVTG